MPMQVRFTNLPRLQVRVVALPGSGGSSGAVDSVFGRTGTVTAVSGDYTVAQVTGAAPTASPALTGTPTAPTAGAGTNTDQIATTAFVLANSGSGSFSGSPLLDVDDTNVTLAWSGGTLTAVGGGTVTLTAGWTGNLAVGRGGIGTTTLTSNAVLLGAGTSSVAPLATGATATVLTSPGGGAAPTWSAPTFQAAPVKQTDDTNVTLAWSGATATAVNGTVTLTAGWTGQLAVSRGGVGTSTLVLNGVLVGAGATAVAPLAAAGSGTVLTGVASSAPAFTTTVQLGVPAVSLGQLVLAGNTSGTITIKGQAAAGSYNFNLPTSAGTSGQPLISGGGTATAMTFGTLGVPGGGLGTTTWIPYAVICGGTNATATLQNITSVGSLGNVLTSNGASALPTFQAPTAAANTFAGGIFTRVGSTTVKFAPYNGDRIKINGTMFAIPTAGIVGGSNTNTFVNGVAASSLGSSTIYYAYAFSNSGTVTFDFSTTAHTTSITSGNEGIEIKSGDDTRSLVGMIRTNTTSTFVDTATQRFLRSWFNDPGCGLLNTAAGVTTSSTATVDLMPSNRNEFLVWSGEPITVLAPSQFFTSAIDAIFGGVAFNGTTSEGTQAYDAKNVAATYALTPSVVKTGLSEGYNYVTFVGRVATATTTATFTLAVYGHLHK